MELSQWLEQQRLVVCGGSGGVGKTTLSATLGLWAALHGRKVMVLTIDPARRLANSLGLKAIGNDAVRIEHADLKDEQGELWVMMLDSRGAFDSLVTRLAPDEDLRDRIIGNRIYRYMAGTFAGTHEYMATEKLYDLVSDGGFDLVVLDTPPVKNALDFLESPGRLLKFLDERVLNWFLVPYEADGSRSRRFVFGTSALLYRLIGTVFGKEFITDLAEFFQDFKTLYAGFRERHDAVLNLFRSTDTSFVTVCAPSEASVEIASFFEEELYRRELPSGGVIVNQVHHCHDQEHDATSVLAELAQQVSPDGSQQELRATMARLSMAHRRRFELAKNQAALTESLRNDSQNDGFYKEVPWFRGEVHDVSALLRVAEHLFG